MVTVEPPRWGDPMHPARKTFQPEVQDDIENVIGPLIDRLRKLSPETRALLAIRRRAGPSRTWTISFPAEEIEQVTGVSPAELKLHINTMERYGLVPKAPPSSDAELVPDPSPTEGVPVPTSGRAALRPGRPHEPSLPFELGDPPLELCVLSSEPGRFAAGGRRLVRERRQEHAKLLHPLDQRCGIRAGVRRGNARCRIVVLEHRLRPLATGG